MLKSVFEISFKKDDKECRFSCDHDSPFDFIKDSLFQCITYIGKVEEAAKQANNNVESKEEDKNCEKCKCEDDNKCPIQED